MQDAKSDNTTDTYPSPFPASERMDRVRKGFYKPTAHEASKGGSVTIEERQKREAEVRACVKLGMTVEQMREFLPTRGLPMGRSTIYEYLRRMKLPKNYKPSQHGQSHHQFFTLSAVINIAKDAPPLVLRNIECGRSPGEGAGFRYDFKFEIEDFLFFGEMQLSDLAGTNWRKKARQYVRWYRKIKQPFRVLFIIDQKNDMHSVRRHCREVLKTEGHPDLNLFLFCTLDDLVSRRRNLAYAPAWMDKMGTTVPLIKS